MTFEEWWGRTGLRLDCVAKMPENPVHVAHAAWQAAKTPAPAAPAAPAQPTPLHGPHGTIAYNADGTPGPAAPVFRDPPAPAATIDRTPGRILTQVMEATDYFLGNEPTPSVSAQPKPPRGLAEEKTPPVQYWVDEWPQRPTNLAPIAMIAGVIFGALIGIVLGASL